MNMQLHGIHHVTAVTGNVGTNLDFYTHVLGLRLVKKTVNQDDVSAYHLFYADKVGTPGTDITFFDWPQTGADRRGTDSIGTKLFRANGDAAPEDLRSRFGEHNVKHSDIEKVFRRELLRVEDPGNQRVARAENG